MTRKTRTLALVMSVTLVFVMLFSFLFIAQNADHHCTQEDCSICQQLEACENTLNAVALVAVAAGLATLFHRECKVTSAFCTTVHHFDSPVSLKVKLSN